MNINRDFTEFTRCLIKAATRIEGHYFQLPVAGSEIPIFRERVYCYELYHQLRFILGDNFPYKLDGEVDKAGHPYIEPLLGAKKPDFIVHIPRQMDGNLVVIEVKPITTRINEFRDDLSDLQKLLLEAEYHYAIMLLYGDKEDSLPTNMRIEAVKWLKEYSDQKLLLWHRRPRERPVVFRGIDVETLLRNENIYI